jgi:hypothetical protein
MRPSSDGMRGEGQVASSSGAHAPLARQQFSARYPSRAFMAEKSAL